MHPVHFLFDEIMRHYWGMQRPEERPSRKDNRRLGWRYPQLRRTDDRR